ncbi:MAG: hypothetical protein R3F43_27190 [bacterium]
MFDPAAEIVLAGQPVPAVAHQLRRDLETLPMFLAAADDAVQVERPLAPSSCAPSPPASTLPELSPPGRRPNGRSRPPARGPTWPARRPRREGMGR